LNINAENVKRVFLSVLINANYQKSGLNWVYLHEIDFYALVQHILIHPMLMSIRDSKNDIKDINKISLNQETGSDRCLRLTFKVFI
jgi:hypothetical protein